MAADFRGERMASPEGEGRAKDGAERAWRKFYKTNKAINDPLYAALPFLKTLSKGYAASQYMDLFGFWMLWHLLGGFENMQKVFGLSRSSMFRRVALFRETFGEHPDVYEFPGITIDPVEFAKGMSTRSENEEA